MNIIYRFAVLSLDIPKEIILDHSNGIDWFLSRYKLSLLEQTFDHVDTYLTLWVTAANKDFLFFADSFHVETRYCHVG
jgi:hypothetical protein